MVQILSLGGNIDTDRNIIDLVTKKIKNEITIIQNKLETLASLDINPEDRQNRQENLEKKLASLSTRNDALEKSISAAATSDCTICCDTLSHPTITPCCNNMFCAACLLQWAARNTVCPLCRSKFQISDLQTINNEEPVKKNNKKITRKDKTSVLIDIVKRNPNGRHLVFSGHSITFTEMGQILRNEGITYGVLTTTLNTEKTITKFRRGELQVILLDAENNGAGLDLKEATDVILYHQMRKSLEIQTVARAQRPGRDGQLRVWKLKYSHEY